MSEKRTAREVLVVTYSFPPAAHAGVPRVLKFTKYLPHYGWHPVVLTAWGGFRQVDDYESLTEVRGATLYHAPALELGSIRRWFASNRTRTGMSSATSAPGTDSDPPGFARTAETLKRLLLRPDPWVLWNVSAVQTAVFILRRHALSALFVTIPPHSLALLACILKRLSGLPLVVDYRDPWTLPDWYPWENTPFNNALERYLVGAADRLVYATETMREGYQRKYPSFARKMVTITNGFDPDDFTEIASPRESQPFTVTHTGVFYPRSIPESARRDPRVFLKAVRRVVDDQGLAPEALRIRFVGPVAPYVVSMIRSLGLEPWVELTGALPRHHALQAQLESDVLLLLAAPAARSVVPGKLFEYLGANKPILYCGPTDCEGADIVRTTARGVVCDGREVSAIAAALKRLVQGEFHFAEGDELERYDRRHLTGRLARVLNSVCRQQAALSE